MARKLRKEFFFSKLELKLPNLPIFRMANNELRYLHYRADSVSEMGPYAIESTATSRIRVARAPTTPSQRII